MRILLAGDLHYMLRQYDWLNSVAGDFDALVIAGDHVDAFGALPAQVQIEALKASFLAIAEKTQVFVSSGNHDLNTRTVAGEKTADWLAAIRSERLAVDGDSVSLGSTLFTVCPWWDGPAAQAKLLTQLKAGSVQRTGDWVWIYHAPPPGPLSWTGRRHYADGYLGALIERFSPTAVLCGHIHEAPFKSEGSWLQRIGQTWCFNAGRQPGDIPARVEIDLASAHARWISLAGLEESPLNGSATDLPIQ